MTNKGCVDSPIFGVSCDEYEQRYRRNPCQGQLAFKCPLFCGFCVPEHIKKAPVLAALKTAFDKQLDSKLKEWLQPLEDRIEAEETKTNEIRKIYEEAMDNFKVKINRRIEDNKLEIRNKRCQYGREDVYNNNWRLGGLRGVDVYYGEPFPTSPAVFLTSTKLDTYENYNLRLNLYAQAISNNKIVLYADKWGDTRVHSWVVTWMACPA